MSDLLSPMLIIMDDEVEAFWCLCGLMDDLQLCMNFDMEQEGMKRQLIQLNSLLQVIEPKFYSYLRESILSLVTHPSIAKLNLSNR
eukprot:XP_011661205.1 PREDICTED: TBC1 domain family member 15-like [Strongylocentrotus purpuratus]